MNLKDLFDAAENGILSYEQFIAAADAKKAKFVDLSDGGYVARQKYTDDLADRDTRISTLNTTIANRDTDLNALKAQLESAGTDATKLKNLGRDFADLQDKYNRDTQAYQAQLREQAYKYAVNDFANTKKFTSKAAKRDFTSAMLAKNLTIENDVLIGASDFVDAYTKENPDAFVVEDPNPAPAPQPESLPHFVNPTSPKGGDTGDVNPFQFNFTGVRPHTD